MRHYNVSNLLSISTFHLSFLFNKSTWFISVIAAWLAQLVERQSAVREVEGSSPRPDQHSGS